MAIIGIDLGTTYSLACYWENGQIVMIPQEPEKENYLLPSQVYIKEDNTIIVGNDINSQNGADKSDGKLFYSFKNFMGTNKQYVHNGIVYTPIDFSAMILRKIKENTEAYLQERNGEVVEEAIISVPAYFNDKQRSDTKKAAYIAGLHVERIINEPSAAALMYRMGEKNKMQNLMVFDFGGGTLDISMVECFENITEIVAIVGDNHLGGNDIDLAIAKKYYEEQSKSGQYSQSPDFSELDEKEKLELLREAEKCKCGEKSIISMDRDQMFYACSEIFSKIKKLFDKILKDSEKEICEIDELIMVGGSSKWKLVQEFMKELYHKAPVVLDRPDFAVAMGVGIYAGIRNRKEDIKDLVLTDVCPFTLGTGVVSREHIPGVRKRLFPMIERNTTLPASVSHIFSTVDDYQSLITIEVFQGEEYDVEKDVCLGQVTIDVPMRKAGESSVFVTFCYDINGIIRVIVKNENNEEKDLLIANHEMSDQELKERLEKLKSLKTDLALEDERLREALEKLMLIYKIEHGREREAVAGYIAICENTLLHNRRVEKQRILEEVRQYIMEWEKENEYLENITD